ncbi:MAG: GspE/PulE family protein [Minisyncoccia bacterium]
MNLSLEELKNLLLKNQLITETEFQKIVQEASRTEKDIVDLLVSEGYLTRDYYAELLADYLKVERVKLIGREIPKEILNLIPEEIARTKNAVAFQKEGNALFVAMLNPVNLETIEFLEKYTRHFIKPYLCLEEDLKYAFSLYGAVVSADFKKIIEENIRAVLKIKGLKEEEAAVEFPIVSLLENLISYAASLNATDIHIEPLANDVLIRFRIDGLLREIVYLPKEIHPGLVARIKILSNLQIDEHNKPQDGRMKYKYANVLFDIRVSIIPTMHGEKAALRLLASATKPMSFEELGMLEETIKIVKENISKSYGMILVTGPTGSGKTTTLYAVLNALNKPEVNIITIEDPIEYELKFINQIQVNPKAGIDFANGLRAILRQDPNIIMVGEIRDQETAEIAVHAALTGHLVLSTLHTNDAPTAVPRLFDLGVPPFLVASTLNLVIAQRLVRKICRDCIYSYTPTKEDYDLINDHLKGLKGDYAYEFKPKFLYKGKGCSSCNYTGYRGRLAIYEAFNINEEIREYIIRKDFSLDGLKKLAYQMKEETMFEDGLKKMERGLTTLEEVLRVIKE